MRGTFTPIAFRVSTTGKLVAKGTLRSVVIAADGGRTRATQVVNTLPVRKIDEQSVSAATARQGATPSAAAAGSCDILNLVLGPVDLNVLGLQVHLQTVVLDIIAVTGAGQLLGNLLCAVAGLLDGSPLSGLLAQVSALLNSILAILRA